MSIGHPDSQPPRLVADIGGTNARFATLAAGERRASEPLVLRCADYPDLVTAINVYLERLAGPRPKEAAIAVATPITSDRVSMTNHVWSFSIEQTRRQLGLDRFLVINDFTALAMALPHLEAADLHPVGSGQAVPETPVALLGPGTGLGVSGLIHCGTHWMPLEGEGGHVTYGAANHRQAKIVSIVGERYSHVSAERLLSGQGLMNLYHAIATLHGVEIEPLSPPDITGRALKGSCPVCAEVLETFCAMLGTVAGNLVLTLGARRGVYIGGGIVPRLGAYFDTSPFRESFERKGRFTSYLASVPSYVIRAQYPALLGVAAALVGEGRAVSAGDR